MRQLGFIGSFVTACALALFVQLFAPSAHATVTVTGFDESRISSFDGIGTNTVVMYGGLAGASCGNSTTSTCSNCWIASAATTGDAALVPCNDRRINPSLVAVIYFKSDATAGYPTIVSTTGASPIAVTQASTPTYTGVGQIGAVTVAWSELCAKSNVGGTTGTASDATCSLGGATSDYILGKFKVGMSVANDGTLDTGDDAGFELTVIAKVGDATNKTASSDHGIVHFELKSGDGLGEIQAVQAGASSNFPNSTYGKFRWARLLFEQRPETARTTTVWDKINPGSPHVDLDINAPDTATLELSPVRISHGDGILPGANGLGGAVSKSLENDKIYDFKIAVLDPARNVGYYTAAANDEDCPESSRSTSIGSGGSGKLECHTLRPSEVAGILANKVNCFVATAAYGSPMAREVDTFRAFRDTFLIPNRFGKAFVRFYYEKGPVAAHFIRQSETLRAIARGFLWAPLQFAKFSLAYGFFAALSLLLALGFAPFAIMMIVRRYTGREHPHA